ncbi:hypothetical protein AWZ03_009160 [Drosophila navojoa]|uniref:Uncharacterized protein n=1 Tax=Drosophila navojoa TaxID=7232 RepID=A0A484B9A1_DRONA|nr:hypothetical protein AWZ03_009160 [Drosophila navojoa]
MFRVAMRADKREVNNNNGNNNSNIIVGKKLIIIIIIIIIIVRYIIIIIAKHERVALMGWGNRPALYDDNVFRVGNAQEVDEEEQEEEHDGFATANCQVGTAN